MSGKYVCEAYNNVTDMNSTAYTMLTVVGETWMATFMFLLSSFSCVQEKVDQEGFN